MTAPTPYTPPEGHVICLLRSVPERWEYRRTPEDKWYSIHSSLIRDGAFVEARPVRQPDPHPYITNHEIVTTVGEMRDRTDLDQWEYADTDPETWGWVQFSYMSWSTAPSDLPVIVRRKQVTS